jgi:hypothetical protein
MSFDYKTVRPPILSIDNEHWEIHGGNFYTVSKTNRVVPTNHYVYHRIKATDLSCHVKISWGTEFKCYLRTYEGSVFSVVNVPYLPFNRIIGLDKPCLTEWYTLQTATPVNLGVLRGDDAVGASGNPQQRAGGSGSGSLETIIPPNQEMLIEVQNVGVEGYIDITCNFYEA